jgi:5'(3')-deoxyribonucleotidase
MPQGKPIRGVGESAKTKQGRRQHRLLFNRFIRDCPDSGLKDQALEKHPSAHLCSKNAYELFSGFLIHDAKQKNGKCYAISTCLQTLSGIMQQAKNILDKRMEANRRDQQQDQGTSEGLLFLQRALNPRCKSEPSDWLNRLKLNMRRIRYEEYLEGGEKMYRHVRAVYGAAHLTTCIAALSGTKMRKRIDEAEAARRCSILLTARALNGRSAETALMSPNFMHYDDHFKVTVVDAGQQKTSKDKTALLIAGNGRHCCWLAHFAIYMHYTDLRNPKDDDGDDLGISFLFPSLQIGQPGAAISGFLRAMENVQGVKLPEKPTAQGLRRGATNELAHKIPMEIGVRCTGHDLKELSAYNEYVEVDIPYLLGCSGLLASWPPPPWGQPGNPVMPPSLDELNLSEADIQGIICRFFGQHTLTLTSLCPGGNLYQMVRDAMAAFIMYYNERRDAAEFTQADAHLRETWATVLHSEDLEQPGAAGIQWAHNELEKASSAIKEQFVLANANLSISNNTDNATLFRQCLATMKSHVRQLEKKIEQQKETIDAILLEVLTQRNRSVQLVEGPKAAAADVNAQLQASPAKHRAVVAGSLRPPVTGVRLFASSGNGSSRKRKHGSECGVLKLAQAASAANPPKLMTYAHEVFRLCIVKNYISRLAISGNRQHLCRAKKVYNWYSHMATKEEIEEIKNVGQGKQLDVIAKVERFIKKKLVELYELYAAAGASNRHRQCVQKLKKLNRLELKTSAFISHISNKQYLCGLDDYVNNKPNVESFREWRRKCENGGAETPLQADLTPSPDYGSMPDAALQDLVVNCGMKPTLSRASMIEQLTKISQQNMRKRRKECSEAAAESRNASGKD